MPVEYCDSRGSADHTLHFHALFTSSLVLLYAFRSTGHKQAGINEWQKSNIYAAARAPKAGHVTAGRRRDNFLPRGLRGGVKSAASGRKEDERIMFVVAIYRGREKMLLGTVDFLQYLFLCDCSVDLPSVVCLRAEISVCYFGKQWSSHAHYTF